jgi:hypothetical protein
MWIKLLSNNIFTSCVWLTLPVFMICVLSSHKHCFYVRWYSAQELFVKGKHLLMSLSMFVFESHCIIALQSIWHIACLYSRKYFPSIGIYWCNYFIFRLYTKRWWANSMLNGLRFSEVTSAWIVYILKMGRREVRGPVQIYRWIYSSTVIWRNIFNLVWTAINIKNKIILMNTILLGNI